MKNKPKPDDRRDNVDKIQYNINKTIQNIELAEEMIAKTDDEKTRKALEEKNITPISSEIEWIPLNTVSVTEEQANDVMKLIARVEEDDDVQQVFHNMA